MFFKGFSALAIATIGLASSASAATVEFTTPDWTNQDGVQSSIQYDVIIDDTTKAGSYHVDVSINAGSTATGDALLFALDSIFNEATDFVISGFSSNTGDAITGICYDQSGCGQGGGDFGSATPSKLGGPFDLIVRIGSQGGGAQSLNTNFSFDLDYVGPLASLPGLQGFTFTRAGMRVQTVLNDPINTSLKLFNDDPNFDDPNIVVDDVPLPAAGWMLIAALGGIGAMKRRKG